MTTQKQEPVTKLSWHPGFGFIMDMTDAGRKLPQGTHDLYTSPPQRTWVGLSEEEEEDILRRATSMNMAIAKTEAKLKEKNT